MISTRGRYALRVMIDLAEHIDEGYIPLQTIAKRQGISEKYLESILAVLSKAGCSTPCAARRRLPPVQTGEGVYRVSGIVPDRGDAGPGHVSGERAAVRKRGQLPDAPAVAGA